VSLDSSERNFDLEIASTPILGAYGLGLHHGNNLIGFPIGDDQLTTNAGNTTTFDDVFRNTFLKHYVRHVIWQGTNYNSY